MQSLLENCSEPDIEDIRCRWPFEAPLMLQVSMRSHLAKRALGPGEGERDTCLSLSHIYTHTFLGLGTFFFHKDMFYDYAFLFMTKQSHIRLRGSGV